MLQIFLEPEDNGLVKSSRFQCPMGEHKCHHVAAALCLCLFASLIVFKYSWSLGHPESSLNFNQIKIKYNDKKDIKVSVKNTQILIFYVHVLP